MRKTAKLAAIAILVLILTCLFPLPFLLLSILGLLFCGGYLLHQPFRDWAEARLRIKCANLRMFGAAGMFLLVAMLSIMAISNYEKYVEQKSKATAAVTKAMKEAEKSLQSGDLEAASRTLRDVANLDKAENLERAKRLLLDCEKVNSEEHLLSVMVEMPDGQFSQFLKDPSGYEATHFENKSLNNEFLKRLRARSADAKQIREKEQKRREEARQAEEMRQKEAAARKRQQELENSEDYWVRKAREDAAGFGMELTSYDALSAGMRIGLLKENIRKERHPNMPSKFHDAYEEAFSKAVEKEYMDVKHR